MSHCTWPGSLILLFMAVGDFSGMVQSPSLDMLAFCPPVWSVEF
jgi:hypothetical protein